MGVLNVTPDSFYDGGRYSSAISAVKQGLLMYGDGAAIIDVGGESTRPGAEIVPVQEEIKRVVPVIASLRREYPAGIISIDTRKSVVAQAALDAGAHWVNDVSAGRYDIQMPVVCASAGCPVILMHSRETPLTMQSMPHYTNVVNEVRDELLAAVATFCGAGVHKEQIILDPGIGFAKRLEDNVLLVKNISALVQTGFRVLLGPSRKSFIGALTGREPDGRLPGTLAAIGRAFSAGVRLFRVHDVRETVDYLKVAAAIGDQ
jgi:dihydropteroate synthase